MDIAEIFTAAINAATQGITATTAVQTAAGAATAQTSLSPLKILHLRMICGVATNADISDIWIEVAGATTKQVGLALLVQFLMGGVSVCCRNFLGHSDLLLHPRVQLRRERPVCEPRQEPGVPGAGGGPCGRSSKAKRMWETGWRQLTQISWPWTVGKRSRTKSRVQPEFTCRPSPGQQTYSRRLGQRYIFCPNCLVMRAPSSKGTHPSSIGLTKICVFQTPSVHNFPVHLLCLRLLLDRGDVL